MLSRWRKTAALFISALCATLNLAIACQLFILWHTFKHDSENEWEGLASAWVKALNVLGGLASLYFLSAAAANVVGFVGIVKRYPRCVRFWRDFAIADLACTTTATVFAVYASSRYYDIRNGLCEELSRHDDVMMDLAEMGITLENCEQWSQRAVFAFVVFLVIIHLARLYLVITVSQLFARMSHHARKNSNFQRIYLLPSMPGTRLEQHQQSSTHTRSVVYAPISLDQLSERDVEQLLPREAWIMPDADASVRRVHGSGRIGLPIRPGEGLLPSPREK